MSTKLHIYKLLSILVISALLFSGIQPLTVQAQNGDGIERQVNAESGKVSFISPESGRALSATKALGTLVRPQDPAMALAKRFAPEFGVQDPERDLSEIKKNHGDDGRLTVHYQQTYQGIPVMGGELIVNTNENGDLYSMNGEVSPDISLPTQPTIDSAQACETALRSMAKWYEKKPEDFITSEPELWIFDESLLMQSTRPVELVWRMEVTSKEIGMPVRELVLVNAQRGGVSLHFNQVDTSYSMPIHTDLQNPATLPNSPLAAATIVKYEDLVVDEARNRLYGADKVGNKVDVIDMTDLSIVSSYNLVYGSAPAALDLSPDGNELAVAQSALGFIKFINLTDGSMSENPVVLTGSSTKVTDVIYGRSGILYALSSNGLHVMDLAAQPHLEMTAQYSAGEVYYGQRSGIISSDKNTLYYVAGSGGSAYNGLDKYDVSTGLVKPTLLQRTHLYGTGYMQAILRLSLINDNALLITSGSVYNTADLTPKAKNFQSLNYALALTGRDFYVTLTDNTSGADTLNFFDSNSSFKVSSLSTGVIGTVGAMAITSDGNTVFVSSTGGMAKLSIGVEPPGGPVALPASQHQYKDLAIDLPRGLVYGTDTSGRIDVIDIDTTNVVSSYLLPSGAKPIGIDLSPNGDELAIALNGLEKLLFIDPETGLNIAEVTPQLANDIYYQNQPFDLIYGKAGRLYSSGNPGSSGIDYVHVIDTASHSWITKSPYPNTIRTDTEFALNQSQTYLYANQTFSPNNLTIYDVQTDVVTELYQGPHGPVSVPRFAIIPDGSKIFTSTGQVWDSIMQSQLGSLEGAPGKLIEYIPNQSMVVLAGTGTSGDVLKFISSTDYHLIATFTPSPAGTIYEMEVAADGSILVLNINNQIKVLHLDSSLPSFISIESGNGQSTLPQTQFPLPLKVKVGNYLGVPLVGATVTFTAPLSGASGKFAGTNSNTTTAITDANGIATSSAFTANSIKGAYTVKATAPGLGGSADFQLANGDLQSIKTYTANNGTALPGTFLCNESTPACTNGANLHADKAHQYAIGTYEMYLYQHNRNGINGNNLPIISTVHYSSGYANAFWNGQQMVYGDYYGFPLADDVVAHELTHGVTEYESNLFYYYQSGAINESFSDLWGEYYDQTNGLGTDTGYAWLLGEDVAGYGAMRSMSNPPAYGDPDKMSSPYYQMLPYYNSYWDNGGVHTNSGVNNKAVYLMVDGGTFNGKTVAGLGWDKVGAIYYEVQTNLLSSGADYSDLYYALQQACTNLTGQNGIAPTDCAAVKNAVDAVEMNLQPVPNYNTNAPLCATAGTVPNVVFADDLENGLGNWAITNGTYTRWQLDAPYGPYAQSGNHSLFAYDYPSTVTDARAQLASFTVPANAYLHFAQAYEFEYYGSSMYDGGVLEYSTNGGATWADAGSLMDYNGYSGTISANYGNPLGGRSAFVGSSHGYISTRLNLATLAGKNVSFRWRMGLDEYGYAIGWWVDNIKLYSCVPENPNLEVIVGGLRYGVYDLPSTTTVLDNFSSLVDGPVKVVSTNGENIVASQRAIYGSSFNEMMGYPVDQFTTEYWFPWYDGVYMTTWVLVGNPSASQTAYVDIYIGGVKQGATRSIPPGNRITPTFPGVLNGPVRVVSVTGSGTPTALNIFASERSIYNGSFNEVMGYPANQFAKEYWFPWYDGTYMTTWVLVGNPSASQTAYVDIYIGGVKQGATRSIPPSGNITPTFPGTVNGPVRVVSVTGSGTPTALNIFSSERTIYQGSFSEVMGVPLAQFTTEYHYTWYDNQSLATWLLVGNPSASQTAYVDIYIGGVKQGATRSIPPNGNITPRFALSQGPVRVVSVTGTGTPSPLNIFTSERTLYGTSFNEMMGYPANQLTTEYWFTWYDSVYMQTNILVGKP